MVYEANPAAIFHQGRHYGLPLMPLQLSDIDSVRYVYSLYPEAAKLKDPDGENSIHYGAWRQVRKYSPGS
jgi:hypothetical protein